MKKNILTALFALLTVALNCNAQNNTYNMVIEMANGTKINIGPNDVKNISFNNGELVMTGEDINSLVEKQNKTEERLDSLADVHKDEFSSLINVIYNLRNDINSLVEKQNKTEERLDSIANVHKDEFSSLINVIYNLRNDISSLTTNQNNLNVQLAEVNGKLAMLETSYQNLASVITSLAQEIEELRKQSKNE